MFSFSTVHPSIQGNGIRFLDSMVSVPRKISSFFKTSPYFVCPKEFHLGNCNLFKALRNQSMASSYHSGRNF
jgi:hypothetical protein